MDLEERIKIAVLTKYYGNLLTERQSTIIRMYVDNNLSLSEVSVLLGITRQAVKDALDTALDYLYDLENKLGVVDRVEKLKQAINAIPPTGIDKSAKTKLLKLLED